MNDKDDETLFLERISFSEDDIEFIGEDEDVLSQKLTRDTQLHPDKEGC